MADILKVCKQTKKKQETSCSQNSLMYVICGNSNRHIKQAFKSSKVEETICQKFMVLERSYVTFALCIGHICVICCTLYTVILCCQMSIISNWAGNFITSLAEISSGHHPTSLNGLLGRFLSITHGHPHFVNLE